MDVQILDIPLSAMKICGFDPSDNSLLAKVKCFIAFIIIFVMLVTSVLEILLSEWSIASFVLKTEALMSEMQGGVRWFLFFTFKRKLYETIQEAKTLWNINEADPDDESRAGDTINLTRKGIVFYTHSSIVTGAAAIIVPIVFTWRETLPFIAWFPQDFTYGYEIFFVTQAFGIMIVGTLVVAADTLFCALCGILIGQFKLLNRKLESTKKIETNKDCILILRESVLHHLKLIEFGNTLATIFSVLLLFQYVITLALTCAELYTVSENIKEPFYLVKSLSILVMLLLQMGVYCFLAEDVMNESQNTGLAVYKSAWYNRDIKEANEYVKMIMRRASKPVTFNAGGLVLMGRVAWLNVFKASYSVFTLLTSVK